MKYASARACACFVFTLFAACSLTASASAELICGVAAVGNATAMVTWDSATPTNLVTSMFVTGLQPNETLVGIDARTSTGQLYALGSTSRLYTVDSATGVAEPVGAGTPFAPLLSGNDFGFEFDPVLDRVRVVSNSDINYLIDPVTGQIDSVLPNVSYGNATDPNVVHLAHTNNVVPAVITQLFGVDSALDQLVEQNVNTGALSLVGGLGLDVSAIGGFDVSPSGAAYAALLPAGLSTSQFYTIDLTTGAATLVDQIDGGLLITAMAVLPDGNIVPEPATLALSALAILGCGLTRRLVA
jgi:hypothetical protein